LDFGLKIDQIRWFTVKIQVLWWCYVVDFNLARGCKNKWIKTLVLIQQLCILVLCRHTFNFKYTCSQETRQKQVLVCFCLISVNGIVLSFHGFEFLLRLDNFSLFATIYLSLVAKFATICHYSSLVPKLAQCHRIFHNIS